jgi:hypothetical protein
LSDGTRVYLCILLDDSSRYAVAAVAGRAAPKVGRLYTQAPVPAGNPASPTTSGNPAVFGSSTISTEAQDVADIGRRDIML